MNRSNTRIGGNMYRFSRWLAAAGALLFIASCAQSVGDVNRVQPNVTKKADLLDGVIYLASPDSLRANDLTGFIFLLLSLYNENRGLGGRVPRN